jgi:cell division protein ZapA (FtsZ GTPase activity inhibitor)
MPPVDRRIVKVRILDREYSFASKGEEADAHIREVAHLVDEKMREVGRNARDATPPPAPLQAAVLAGLELVDELLRMQRDVSSVEEDISERTNRLTESLGQLFREVETD